MTNAPANSLALTGATVYTTPADAPLRNATVLIENGTISHVAESPEEHIPPDTTVLGCSGLNVTAGFWNSHVHFFERKWANAAEIPEPELARQLQDMLTGYGFTSVFDLSSPWDNTRAIRDRIESGEVPGPRIRSTGEGIMPTGGMPPDYVAQMMGAMKTPLPEVSDATQAAAAARKLLERGVDAIKLFASSPWSATLSEDVIRAAVEEAHRAGKRAFLHPNTTEEMLAALRAGVDVIAHTTARSGPWTGLTELRAALTPTLTIWKYFLRHDRFSTQEKTVQNAIEQLRTWIVAGGTVLYGSDLGAVDYDPGDEYRLMSEAGMSFPEILASLTTKPAALFGESDKLGRIAAGMSADLVVFKELTDVVFTIREGHVIYEKGRRSIEHAGGVSGG
jgi:imidazolonepropionase-like amidohydrolase